MQGQKGEREDTSQEQRKTVDRCWVVLRFSKPRAPSHTPAIRIQENSQERQVLIIKGKEQIFLTQAFLPQENIQHQISWSKVKMAQLHVTEKEIEKALFSFSVKKAPGTSYLNFKVIRLLWSWDRHRIIGVVQKSIQLGYYPTI